MGATASSAGRDLNVLVVDDTIVYRKVLKDIIGELPGVQVVGAAPNGRLALAKMEHTPVDFVVLDIEMPEMNGLEALEAMRERWPDVGVLMVSGSTRSSADLTVEALARGAIDFVAKADGPDPKENRALLKKQLGFVLRSFSTQWNLRHARAAVSDVPAPRPSGRPGPRIDLTSLSTGSPGIGNPLSASRAAALLRASTASLPPPVVSAALVSRLSKVEVVVIGSSTGGPQALAEVIPRLPGGLGVPVLIVQHMPPVFTASLARNLDSKSQLSVREAQSNDLVEPNVAYIAPGGFHMAVRVEPAEGRGAASRRIVLNEEPPENSCRPSADVLFRSVANAYHGNTLSVVMTGMGDDGARGVAALKERGSYCLTQDEASCTIYGMPRAVEQAGLSDEQVDLARLAPRIVQVVRSASLK